MITETVVTIPGELGIHPRIEVRRGRKDDTVHIRQSTSFVILSRSAWNDLVKVGDEIFEIETSED